MVDKEFIDFNEIKQIAGIFDKEQFSEYLTEVYKDLFNRTSINNKMGISKITFMEYLKIPIFICEKLFSSFDKDKDGFVNFHEFHSNFLALYQGSFEQTLLIIFNLLDFNKDDWIEKADVKLLLSHLPLSPHDNIKVEYSFQMESLDEIDEIINKTFEGKNKLSFPQFKSIVINRKSDIYFQLLLFFYQSKPFENTHIKMVKSKKSFRIEADDTNEKYLNSPLNSNNNYQIKILSPNKRTKLSPVANFFGLNINANNKNDIALMNTQMVRLPNAIVRDEQKHSKMEFTSPSNYFKENAKMVTPKNKISDFQLNECLGTINEEDGNKVLNKEDITDVIYEDWVYKNDNSAMNHYYLVLVDNAFYSYTDDKKEELLSINNLSGCFIKEKGEAKVKGKKYYLFTLQYPGKNTNYYCESKEIMKTFASSFKQAIKYQNFFDYYEMVDDINEGKFGIVKLGIHKRTSQNVAIKIIKKELRNQDEIEMIKNEIDIMKLCHHPNVVHLLDHFENTDYIFIVMEYLKGGTLESFIKDNKYQVPEKKASRIIAQIANGLQYIHQFGIVHRDLKPDNILLSDITEKAQAKIMDFGLSRVLGPNEKVVEGYGTLAFIAPEVILRIPYGTQIDIWSLGVMIYYMLCGHLPFDGNNCTEEEMAKMTIQNEVKFNNEKWSKVSKEGIELIKKCLNKDPNKRIPISEILKSDWIKGKDAK